DPARRVAAREGGVRASVRDQQPPRLGPDTHRGNPPAPGGLVLRTARLTEEVARDLRALAAAHGVQASYRDATGRRRNASSTALLAVLRALGAPVRRPEDARSALRSRERALWDRRQEPVTVAWEGRPPLVPLRLAASSVGAP